MEPTSEEKELYINILQIGNEILTMFGENQEDIDIQDFQNDVFYMRICEIIFPEVDFQQMQPGETMDQMGDNINAIIDYIQELTPDNDLSELDGYMIVNGDLPSLFTILSLIYNLILLTLEGDEDGQQHTDELDNELEDEEIDQHADLDQYIQDSTELPVGNVKDLLKQRKNKENASSQDKLINDEDLKKNDDFTHSQIPKTEKNQIIINQNAQNIDKDNGLNDYLNNQSDDQATPVKIHKNEINLLKPSKDEPQVSPSDEKYDEEDFWKENELKDEISQHIESKRSNEPIDKFNDDKSIKNKAPPIIQTNNQLKQDNSKLLNQFQTGKKNDFSEEALDSDLDYEESEDEDKCLIDTLMKLYQTDPQSLGEFETNLVEKELAKRKMSAASSSSKLNKNSEVKMEAKLTHSIQKETIKERKQEKVKEIENKAKMDDKQLENKGISKQKEKVKDEYESISKLKDKRIENNIIEQTKAKPVTVKENVKKENQNINEKEECLMSEQIVLKPQQTKIESKKPKHKNIKKRKEK